MKRWIWPLLAAVLLMLAGCSNGGAPAVSGKGGIPEAEMKRIATDWLTKQQKLNEARDEAELKARVNELYIPDGAAATAVFRIARKSLGYKVDVHIHRLTVTALGADAFRFKAMYETTFTAPNGQKLTRPDEHSFVLQKVDGVFKYASNDE